MDPEKIGSHDRILLNSGDSLVRDPGNVVSSWYGYSLITSEGAKLLIARVAPMVM